MNGIKHITSAPYHPSTNGMGERAVQTVKEGLKRLTCGTLETRLSRFLFHIGLHHKQQQIHQLNYL